LAQAILAQAFGSSSVVWLPGYPRWPPNPQVDVPVLSSLMMPGLSLLLATSLACVCQGRRFQISSKHLHGTRHRRMERPLEETLAAPSALSLAEVNATGQQNPLKALVTLLAAQLEPAAALSPAGLPRRWITPRHRRPPLTKQERGGPLVHINMASDHGGYAGHTPEPPREDGMVDEAQVKLQVLETLRKSFGPEHPDSLEALANYAAALRRVGRTSEAEPMLKEVLDISRRVRGPEHPGTVKAMENYASGIGVPLATGPGPSPPGAAGGPPSGSPLAWTPGADRDPRRATRQLLQNPVYRRRSREQFLKSLGRIGVPVVVAGFAGFAYFDEISLALRSALDLATIKILEADDSQFIQNFLTVTGLLFSILAGNAYQSLYLQQEAIYFALFQEVSEAKSLLEQTTLVCAGRPFYQSALACMRDYVKNDLRRTDLPPADLLSTRPMEDPLEAIMYMTSVGVPSVIYETVKDLRQARGTRLGAMQRKFPALGIGLLYLLAVVELLAFPLLGAGTADLRGVLSLQSFLFGCLSGSVMLTLRIIQELWKTSGGVFNVDLVLQRMVAGLEEELELRSLQAPAAPPDAARMRAFPYPGMMMPTPPYLDAVVAPPENAASSGDVAPPLGTAQQISVEAGAKEEDTPDTEYPRRRGRLRNLLARVGRAIRDDWDGGIDQ